jgi:hypothetical protein
MVLRFFLVHVILGIRPPASKEGRGPDSQDHMDQTTVLQRMVKEVLALKPSG